MIATGYRYLKKFGLKRSLAALLLYGSRRLTPEINVREVDQLIARPHLSIDRRLEWYDFTARDIERNREVVDAWTRTKRRPVSTANWLVPDFRDVYAGVRNIFRLVNFLAQKKVENRIVIFGDNPETDGLIRGELSRAFPDLKGIKVLRNPNVDSIPYADISVATYWATAYPLLKFNNTKGKYYFIQDDESMFYEAGVWQALVELTYTFGFVGITTAPPLKEMYIRNFRTEAESFNPCVDRSIFYPQRKSPRDRLQRIFFYARPAMPRNGFELGVLALEKLKRQHPDVEIVTWGSDLDEWNIPGDIKNLGYLSLEETADLYRSCDAGLYLMFTPHPGVIPFELMACGCLVVSNDHSAHRKALRNGYNCILTEPTVSRMVEAFEMLSANAKLRTELFRNGLSTVDQNDWNSELEKVYRFVLGK